MSPSLPIQTLHSGTPEERKAAAQTLLGFATRTPKRLHGSLGRVADALADDHEPVRRAVADTLAEVAVDDPAAVGPVAEALVDALTDESEDVRASVARPLAELAAERPQRMYFAIEHLVPSLTDAERVRENVAWALSSLAPHYPETLAEHIDALTRSLLDDYHPVQQYVLRTLVPLERTYPGLLDVATHRLRDLAGSDVAAVRQAACLAIAANEPPWAREELSERCREDAHPVVRETARGALAAVDGTRPAPADPDLTTATGVFADATLGEWVVVRTDRDDETDFFVGTVTALSRAFSQTDADATAARGLRREDFDSRQSWLAAPRIEPSGERLAVHLHDPVRNAGVNLVSVSDGIGTVYTSPDRDVPSLQRPDAVYGCPADHAHLLAARPGDTLAFEIEGAARDIEVTSAGTCDGIYRVVGENRERGYKITFRPLGPDPMMAVFEKGRAFRAGNVTLTAPE